MRAAGASAMVALTAAEGGGVTSLSGGVHGRSCGAAGAWGGFVWRVAVVSCGGGTNRALGRPPPL